MAEQSSDGPSRPEGLSAEGASRPAAPTTPDESAAGPAPSPGAAVVATPHDDRRWMALFALPIVEVAGVWGVLRMWPADGNPFNGAAVFMAVCLVACIVACWYVATRWDADRRALFVSVAALVTRVGYGVLAFYAYGSLFAGTFATTLFLGPLWILLLLYAAFLLSPFLLLIPVLGVFWGEVAAFALWQAKRVRPAVAVVCAVLQLVPFVGVIALVVLLALGRKARA